MNLFCVLVANSAPIPFVSSQPYLASIPIRSFIRGIGRSLAYCSSKWWSWGQTSARKVGKSSCELVRSCRDGSRCYGNHLKTCTGPESGVWCTGVGLAGRNILQTHVKTLLIPLNGPSLNVILGNKVKQNAQLGFTNTQVLPW